MEKETPPRANTSYGLRVIDGGAQPEHGALASNRVNEVNGIAAGDDPTPALSPPISSPVADRRAERGLDGDDPDPLTALVSPAGCTGFRRAARWAVALVLLSWAMDLFIAHDIQGRFVSPIVDVLALLYRTGAVIQALLLLVLGAWSAIATDADAARDTAWSDATAVMRFLARTALWPPFFLVLVALSSRLGQ